MNCFTIQYAGSRILGQS